MSSGRVILYFSQENISSTSCLSVDHKAEITKYTDNFYSMIRIKDQVSQKVYNGKYRLIVIY
jgi:hypothetical protein